MSGWSSKVRFLHYPQKKVRKRFKLIEIIGYLYKKLNDMDYTQEQIQEWKLKAEKWDKLDKEIESVYCDEDGDDEGGDMLTIGEMAAQAFGWW